MKNLTICDLDNTLAMHPDCPKRTDHSNCQNDIINKHVKAFLDLSKDEDVNSLLKFDIIFLTKRHEKFREQTLEFLNKHFDIDFELIMRTDNDPDNSPDFKKKKFFEINERTDRRILHVIEDDQRVNDMFENIRIENKIFFFMYTPETMMDLLHFDD